MDVKKSKVQVKKDHYFRNYDDLYRFISYFYQIDIIKECRPKKILEIGVGNKTVYNYLKQNSYDVVSCDFDKSLRPDCVADARDTPFKEKSFDLILICEVLEHIPFDQIDKALGDLHRITKRYVIVSVPYASTTISCTLRFPLVEKIFGRKFLSPFIRIPYFWKKIEFSGEHYWELGRKNYSINRVRKTFRKKFKIIKEVRPALNHYHHFFVLEKKK